jgi:hypothetical protein
MLPLAKHREILTSLVRGKSIPQVEWSQFVSWMGSSDRSFLKHYIVTEVTFAMRMLAIEGV